ncbi:MAG TPA: AAA family ATPase [Candidatus Saccharimonadales bacterium]|nr:AAA family ATPase [Candidatus Saccharimonadales bacterium]
MPTPKLIILRGPSGAGKSTVAKKLFENSQPKTALIEQDHYRFMFNPAGGGSKPNSDTIHKMIRDNALTALSDGYDVILEGILNIGSYGEVLEELFKRHPKENYIFYFDISFDETIRRHAIRRTPGHKFNEADMKEWYPSAHKSGHEFEYIIPERFSAEETVRYITQMVL